MAVMIRALVLSSLIARERLHLRTPGRCFASQASNLQDNLDFMQVQSDCIASARAATGISKQSKQNKVELKTVVELTANCIVTGATVRVSPYSPIIINTSNLPFLPLLKTLVRRRGRSLMSQVAHSTDPSVHLG